MAFAVLRTEKLKTPGNISSLGGHLERTKETLNADPELKVYNERLIGSGDLQADVQQRINAANCHVRKNAVLAVEHVMTASPEFFDFHKKQNEKGEAQLWGDAERWKHFEKTSLEWLEKRYGKENIVNVTVHKDEQSPHLHAVIVPIDSRGKLNASHWLDGREKMREMQTSFAEVHEAQGLKRGIEGSRATHNEIKQFYSAVKETVQVGKQHRIEVQPIPTNVLGLPSVKPEVHAKTEAERITKEVEKVLEENKALKAKVKSTEFINDRVQGLEKAVRDLNKEVKKEKEQINNLQQTIKDIAEGKVKAQEVIKDLGLDKKQERNRSNGRGMGL